MQKLRYLNWYITPQRACHSGLIAPLTIWMALFAPMFCQYHGLLWLHINTNNATADAHAWNNSMPGMLMSDMTMVGMHMSVSAHNQDQPIKLTHQRQSYERAVLEHPTVLSPPASNNPTGVWLYNRVPSTTTMLVCILSIAQPSPVPRLFQGADLTFLHLASVGFPLQLVISPLKPPPRT